MATSEEQSPTFPKAATRRRRAADYLGLERNVLVVSTVVFLLGFGEELWKKFLPIYLAQLGAGAVIVGLFGTAKDFFDAVYQYPGGWLADRVGRRAFLVFIGVASVGYLVYLVSPSWPFVFLGLAFSMAWHSMASPAVFAVIGDALPRERRAMGQETERLSKIVESLLAISRLDAGEARVERARLDLAELAETTTEQLRLLAEDKNISLGSRAVRPVEIEGDRARLKQVIVNLLDNAIKYTPEGGSVEVTVRAGDGSALLEVSDSGVGIPGGALPHIFERFYRADKARSRQMGGAGLGLAIVKSICAAHGGRVRVASEEGKGSRFSVELPLAGNGKGEDASRTR